jgi:hypothetical protein
MTLLRTRRQSTEFLSDHVGYPIKFRYFEKLCVEGNGPRVDRWFGKRALYREADLLAWAEARCTRGSNNEAALSV